MKHIDKTYKELVTKLFEEGKYKPNRTEIETPFVLHGEMFKHDLNDGFPAITTKKLAFKSCLAELLWFIEGSNDERRLAEIQYGKPRSELEDKRTIWSDNYDADYWQYGKKESYIKDNKRYGKNFLGAVYGVQWKEFLLGDDAFNQLDFVIDQLKNNPHSRKIIMLSYSPEQIDEAVLTACHPMVQFLVLDGKLNCLWNQASSDVFLGLPFNIASYAILTHMLAQVCNLEVGEITCFLGDAHIYENAVEPIKQQIKNHSYEMPILWLNPLIKNIYDFTMDDVKLIGYKHHEQMKVSMAV